MNKVSAISGKGGEDFARWVLENSPTDKPFKPYAIYDADGDCIEFIIKPDSYYAQRVDALLTVYTADDAEDIVGCQIKGVRDFLRTQVLNELPGFLVTIEDGKITLGVLFLLKLWRERPDALTPVVRKTYKRLADFALENRVIAEIPSDICSGIS